MKTLSKNTKTTFVDDLRDTQKDTVKEASFYS